ncbi:hypothetical protein H5410_060367 [Solanum commersonii]|uniref:NB-ARC domain containing protein n=1 Tax=Solanum commersonii TaxID=4109 RepID=A0A9J5W591_SOLCO|nr:hypothetical protein H5410_060367 [Solanum commersonii]
MENLEIVYDNLPLYCNYCKHQGHDEDSSRLISKRNQNTKQIDDTIEGALKGTTDSEKYQVDVREILNKKRKTVDVDQSKATSLDLQLVVSTFEQNCVDSMDVDTSNIGVQTTTENKGDYNNQQATTNEVQSKEVGLNLMSNTTKNAGGTPRVGVDARMFCKLKMRIQTKNWTLVAHKKSTNSRILSPTSQNNSPCSERGLTENFHDSEKRQDTSNASRGLLCLNSFDALLKTTGKQVSPPALNSKLSSEAPVFVPKCVLAKKNESRALVSNTIDLGEDSLDEDGVDLGEDSLDEDDKNNMLYICFDRVAREGDISPRKQRNGSNKSKTEDTWKAT